MYGYRSSDKDLATCSHQDLQAENQKLKSEIAILKRRLEDICDGIHPYDKKYHFPVDHHNHFMCPCCMSINTRYFVTCTLSKRKSKIEWYAPWRKRYSIEYFLISCCLCKSEYAMHLPGHMKNEQ